MDKSLAEKLALLMSRPEWQAFLDYKQIRLQSTHRLMEDNKGDELIRDQGVCREIRNDMRLKDIVESVLLSN